MQKEKSLFWCECGRSKLAVYETCYQCKVSKADSGKLCACGKFKKSKTFPSCYACWEKKIPTIAEQKSFNMPFPMTVKPKSIDGFNLIEFEFGNHVAHIAEFSKIVTVYDISTGGEELLELIKDYYLDRGKVLRIFKKSLK